MTFYLSYMEMMQAGNRKTRDGSFRMDRPGTMGL